MSIVRERKFNNLHDAMSPTNNIIDFLHNPTKNALAGCVMDPNTTTPTVQTQLLSPGITGGPPAYIDAMGIRYIPAPAAASLTTQKDLESEMEPQSRVGLAARPRKDLKKRINEFLSTRSPVDTATTDLMGDLGREFEDEHYEEHLKLKRQIKENQRRSAECLQQLNAAISRTESPPLINTRVRSSNNVF